MNATAIIQEIELRILGGSYAAWTIGITADPVARRLQHKATEDAGAWVQWQADNEESARYIEEYFLKKGLKGGTGGGKEDNPPTWVYIF